MNPNRVSKISEILEGALALDPVHRIAYLDGVCGSDTELRAEIDSLIDSHERAGSRFLQEAWLDAKPVATDEGQSGRRIGPYRIQERLGRGGMGEVFLAVRDDGQYEKKVALKLVRAGYATAGILERFRGERQILAELDHPNIARLLDGGTTETGIPYLVMELVEGVPIDEFCRKRELSITERLRLFLQVCSAVQFAHQRLVIHRDIKPGNILVTPGGVPKLLDFGIAKMLDPMGSVEATQMRPFTPEYASPEQVRGEPVSTATDAYSLGVVLYELLTGCSPYRLHTRTAGRLAEAITSQEPERPSSSVHRGGGPARLERQLRGDLDFILLKALRKEPEKRYVSAEHLAEDIQRYLDRLPVTARKGTWSYRAGRLIRRHRAAVAGAMLAFVTLIAGIVVTAREARIAEANRRRAEARFNDVRKLAHSLIFDIHDSIRTLPGATDARKLILDRSLEYLDSLAKESGNDPDLLRELATAYSRIGNLQGNPSENGGSLGDSKAAAVSLRKSLELRELLARSNPDNINSQVDLAVSYLDLSDFQGSAAGDPDGSFEYGKRAMSILDRAAKSAPNDFRIILQSTLAHWDVGMMEVGENGQGRFGTITDGIANLKTSLSLGQRALELSPSNSEVPRNEAATELGLGDAFAKLGDRPQALIHYHRGLDLLNVLNSQRDSVSGEINKAVSLERIGDVALVGERPSEAVHWYAEGQQLATRMAAVDPHSEVFRRLKVTSTGTFGHALIETGQVAEGIHQLRDALDTLSKIPMPTPLDRTLEGIGHSWVGEGLERQGRFADAVHEYTTAKEFFDGVRKGGSNDRLTQVYLSSATLRLGTALSKLGKVDDGSREHAEALAVLEPLSKGNPEDQDVLYSLAETYTGLGTDAMIRAEWQAAREFFRKSRGAWGKVTNPARISPSGLRVRLPAEVSELLARCDREIASRDDHSSR
jgi:eukaryotic-like serine/threonine-protein kinase